MFSLQCSRTRSTSCCYLFQQTERSRDPVCIARRKKWTTPKRVTFLLVDFCVYSPRHCLSCLTFCDSISISKHEEIRPSRFVVVDSSWSWAQRSRSKKSTRLGQVGSSTLALKSGRTVDHVGFSTPQRRIIRQLICLDMFENAAQIRCRFSGQRSEKSTRSGTSAREPWLHV